ncbi:hypothetical protein H6F74_20350 [Trichocoleus sp. FACHB-90]|jgi:hypothetical protein|uniref:Uncharacterized protein n=2 Tax=Cyanobacteriota TaxID=1117 RepID=A0ABV0JMI4_9CYAN|nr:MULTISPECIES: hypothetical protein [unclassified Trichocoleus]MBD1836480.1 hypothetical protein [Cyanobacteria bacterium FACHB-472]MBD1928582.1 hypothetical protein [Trichocoleus sp. FACHB-90]MBD1905810.1 hypothetical protein [Trichocoleus sp. FACHB-832]MBD1930838.1 hypothetical protein [Trichocoleus sp. FACHB-69]MBD2004762.1 hypothetical protein [Trichocoleus sp. FACHB-40]
MNFVRGRLQRLIAKMPKLIEKLTDDNLEDTWQVLQQVYYDLYMLKAIQESKQSVQPGESLTREEAIRMLQFP